MVFAPIDESKSRAAAKNPSSIHLISKPLCIRCRKRTERKGGTYISIRMGKKFICAGCKG